MKKIRVILYQKQLGKEIPDRDIREMQDFSPHFVCFPEYFFVDRELGTREQTPENQEYQLERIKSLSLEMNSVVIGGTMPELAGGKLHNTCFIYNRGNLLGLYRKIHLFFAEKDTITPGNEFAFFSAYGVKFGVLICADVLNQSGFNFMRENRVKIIFSPTFSPRKEESVETKFQRDNDIYVRGAEISGSTIVKVCGVRSEFKDFLQARSLIADKNGILYRVMPEDEDEEMIIMKEIEIE
jgi:predicted amidohydrolase